MKESSTLAGNATIKQLQGGMLLNTKGKYMKDSSTLAGNATIKQHQKEILFNTKGQYMKESNTLASNAPIKQVTKGHIDKHKRAVHEGVKYSCVQCGRHLTLQSNLAKHKWAT